MKTKDITLTELKAQMSKKPLSTHQQKIVKNYYQNLDSIMLTKLQELTTELYLTENKAKREKLWQRVEKAMQKLKIKPAVIANIMKTKKPEILAKNLNDWLK